MLKGSSISSLDSLENGLRGRKIDIIKLWYGQYRSGCRERSRKKRRHLPTRPHRGLRQPRSPGRHRPRLCPRRSLGQYPESICEGLGKFHPLVPVEGCGTAASITEMIGLYLADLASGSGPSPALSVSTIERRLSGLAWNYAQCGFTLDRKNRHIATVLAGIKLKHARPPVQKEAILADDIIGMLAALPYDLRGLRDRAILLIGYAGGLRRSEIVSLDVHKDDTPDSGGWLEIMEKGALLTLNAKTGWREVEIGRGSTDPTCPVRALEQWLHFAKIDFGPVFVGTSRDGKRALEARLNDKHVARLIKRTVRDAGIRSDLPEKERLALFSGHSLRAGLASSAEVDERYVQKQLGHASAEMTP